MRIAISRLHISAIMVPFAVIAAPAFAQDEPKGPPDPLSIDFTLAAYNDYRFRGLSLSDKQFAVQPTLTATFAAGPYLSVFASNITPNDGDDIEIDLIAGFSKDIGKVKAGINATYYLYPGLGSINYLELIGTLSTDVGPGNVGVTLGYAPKQSHIGDKDNVYAAINGSLPVGGTPFTLTGSFGFEDGAFGNKKKDWSVGVTAEVVGFTLGAAYVDTAHANEFGSISKAGAVFSISKAF